MWIGLERPFESQNATIAFSISSSVLVVPIVILPLSSGRNRGLQRPIGRYLLGMLLDDSCKTLRYDARSTDYFTYNGCAGGLMVVGNLVPIQTGDIGNRPQTLKPHTYLTISVFPVSAMHTIELRLQAVSRYKTAATP